MEILFLYIVNYNSFLNVVSVGKTPHWDRTVTVFLQKPILDSSVLEEIFSSFSCTDRFYVTIDITLTS